MRHIHARNHSVINLATDDAVSAVLGYLPDVARFCCEGHSPQVSEPALRPSIAGARSRGTLANNIIAELEACGGVGPGAGIAKALVLPGTGRWTLDSSILARAAEVRVDDPRLWQNFPKAIRLPHQQLWLEFSPSRDIWADGLNYDRAGCLITEEQGGSLRLQMAVRDCARVGYGGYIARFGHDGARIEVGVDADSLFAAFHTREQADYAAAAYVGIVHDALKLLIVLNAKHAPIIIGEAEDYTKLNRSRAKRNQCPLYYNRPVRWDAGLRPETAFGKHSSDGEGEPGYHVRRHMQRGHLKFVRGRLVWWSCHYRGQGGGELPPGRDHVVTARVGKSAKKR